MSSPAPVEQKKSGADAYTVEGQLAMVDASEFTDVQKMVLGGLFETVNSIAHILLALLYTYCVGYFGFHVSWVSRTHAQTFSAQTTLWRTGVARDRTGLALGSAVQRGVLEGALGRSCSDRSAHAFPLSVASPRSCATSSNVASSPLRRRLWNGTERCDAHTQCDCER
jgi:hypothetical protein